MDNNKISIGRISAGDLDEDLAMSPSVRSVSSSKKGKGKGIGKDGEKGKSSSSSSSSSQKESTPRPTPAPWAKMASGGSKDTNTPTFSGDV